MANTVVCVVALLIQLFTPASWWFIHSSTPAPGPAVAGYLITGSMFNILLDINIIPMRYRRFIPYNFLNFLELLLSILAMEFSRVVFWTQIEQAIDIFFKCILIDKDMELYESMGGDWLPKAFMIALSLFIYVTTMIITGQVPVLRCRYQHVNAAIQRAWQERND